MKIYVAKTAGFCFGVNRAVTMVEELLKEGRTVCTLGPIIHNPQTLSRLAEQGTRIVEDPKEAPPGSTLVIRSHGVPRRVREEIDSLPLMCVDATCPFVAKIHQIVSEEGKKGRTVLIAGDPKHPEVQGIVGHCTGPCFVFENAFDLEKQISESPILKKSDISVVAQTTFRVAEWRNCLKSLQRVYTNANIFDTICNATARRQEEAEALARTCDAMLVLGGRESSNTAKLYDVCRKHTRTLFAQSAAEIPKGFLDGVKTLGITAGASTPASIIKEGTCYHGRNQ